MKLAAAMKSGKKPQTCLVCESMYLEPLLVYYSPFLPSFFHRIAICRECGHIQLFPLFEEAEYQRINDDFFSRQYMVDDQQNLGNNSRKLTTLDRRLSSYLKQGMDVLDAGAGEAWALDYFREKGCNYFAIEPVRRLADLIAKRGGQVIGGTIFEGYSEYQSHFDVIVFRHILEHLPEPRKALEILRGLLKPAGMVYLALPDGGNPSVGKGFRTSFIRPIHISYFCEGNIRRLAHQAGLWPICFESGGEIFSLLEHSQRDKVDYYNYYTKNREIYLSTARRACLRDWARIANELPRVMLRRLRPAHRAVLL